MQDLTFKSLGIRSYLEELRLNTTPQRTWGRDPIVKQLGYKFVRQRIVTISDELGFTVDV